MEYIFKSHNKYLQVSCFKPCLMFKNEEFFIFGLMYEQNDKKIEYVFGIKWKFNKIY